MAVKTYIGNEGRDLLLKGINIVADAVSVTLGPAGKNVVIGRAGGSLPKITKDGVTVAMSITGDQDPVVDMGMQIIRDAAIEAYRKTGDGTTTSTVLARALIMNGLEAIRNGAKPNDVINDIKKSVKIVTDSIAAQSVKIDINSKELEDIATISANNDRELGKLIAECIRHVGIHGSTLVDVSNTLETYVEKKSGMKVDRGYISQEFITNQKKRECVLENPLVLVYDRKISALHDIKGLLEQVFVAKRSLLVIAEDMDSEALATLIGNVKRTDENWKALGISFCAIKTPNFMNRMAFLEDIATYTNAKVISQNIGAQLQKVTIDQLGSAERIIISDWDTTILNGAGTKESVDSRLALMLQQAEEEVSEKQKEVYKIRYAALSGASLVIYLGRTSGMEISETRDRVDDAVKATKAALEEGIVAGGATSLIWGLGELKGAAPGAKAVMNSLISPLEQILKNAEEDPSTSGNIVDRILSTDFCNGYNAKTSQFCNLLEAGIVDPAKVVRVALEQAAFVATMFLSTNCVVFEI